MEAVTNYLHHQMERGLYFANYPTREPLGERPEEYRMAAEFLAHGKCSRRPDMTYDEAKAIFISNIVWQRNRRGDLEAPASSKDEIAAFREIEASMTAHVSAKKASLWAENYGPLQVRTDKLTRVRKR
jgi:hypothetical protein